MGYYDDAYDSFLGTSTQGSSNQANPDVFLEAYYGKLPEFEEIEKLLDIMIQKARKAPFKSNPNKWEENTKIQKLFCKVFGFKSTYIYWIPHNVPNAFTLTSYSLLMFGDTKDFIEKRPNRGFYDTSKSSVLTVYVYLALLLTDINLTARELLAVMLHEIGHNFDMSPYHLISYWIDNIATRGHHKEWVENNKSVDSLTDDKMLSYYEIRDEYDPKYKDTKALAEIAEAEKRAIEAYNNRPRSELIKSTLKQLMKAMFFGLVTVPIQLYKLDGKMSELFSDSFATAYGYGTELISSLEKMDFDNNTMSHKDNSPTAVFFRDLNKTLSEILSGLTDVHGTDQERAKESLKKLKNDLRTADYPPGMKAELEKEVARLQSYYDTMVNASEGQKKTIFIRWRHFCEKFFGGSTSIARMFKPNKV